MFRYKWEGTLMAENGELIYPEIFTNEFVVNIENIKFTLITQQANSSRETKTTGNIITHFHTCYEVFLCETGELLFYVDNRKITVKPGEMLIVSPEVYHASVGVLPGSEEKCFRFAFSSNGLKSNIDLYKTVAAILTDASVVVTVSDTLADSVSNMCQKSEENDFYSVFKHTCSFLTQLIEITGNIPSRCEGVYADNTELRTHKIRVFINNNINKPIAIKQIADYVGLSTRQTGRIIKYKFGCCFKEYITKLRMEKAGDLLLQQQCQVSEIAAKIGYSSQRGFYTAFKNFYGCLPKEFRKKKQKITS